MPAAVLPLLYEQSSFLPRLMSWPGRRVRVVRLFCCSGVVSGAVQCQFDFCASGGSVAPVPPRASRRGRGLAVSVVCGAGIELLFLY